MHLEDLMEHLSASYPNIGALIGLHFNDDVNYQLASYFTSRYTIYYQHGFNSFGGVCLATAREVPHRIASEFKNINHLIAADVFNSNKKNIQWLLSILRHRKKSRLIFSVDCIGTIGIQYWSVIWMQDISTGMM